jgi:hypothetical protein
MSQPDVEELLGRLDAVEARFAAHAASATPTGLTDPDEGGEERWEAGQVWAHVAEFVAYWHREAKSVLESPAGEPASFGRTKSDEARIAAIERDRHESPAELMRRVTDGLAALRGFVRKLSPDDSAREGRHTVRGLVTVRQIIQVFEVNHLEEHADQLDGLAAGR